MSTHLQIFLFCLQHLYQSHLELQSHVLTHTQLRLLRLPSVYDRQLPLREPLLLLRQTLLPLSCGLLRQPRPLQLLRLLGVRLLLRLLRGRGLAALGLLLLLQVDSAC